MIRSKHNGADCLASVPLEAKACHVGREDSAEKGNEGKGSVPCIMNITRVEIDGSDTGNFHYVTYVYEW